MKKRKIIALAVALLGLAVLLYPAFSNWLSRVNGSVAIQEYSSQLEHMEREKLTRQRELAEKYNSALTGALDSDAALPEDYEKILDFGNGIMGYIRIPAIGVELPIYHGVGEEALSKGVGHMPQTAFPIGGIGNHSVLSSHTGLPEARLFTDLTELETGDLFHISILEESLTYEVDQIKVVLPNNGEDLLPQSGKDYCTLVTCTPYGINSHRLLVRGKRVETQSETAGQPEQKQDTAKEKPYFWAVPFVAAVFGAMALRKKKKERDL